MRRLATRKLKTAIVSAAATLVLLSVGAVPALGFDRALNEAVVLRLINQARTSRGLHALQRHDRLDRAAFGHSRDMIRHDYFAHSTLAGMGIGARIRQAGYDTSGCSQWSVGEVIAFGSGAHNTPASIFRAWMHSSGHRAAILGKGWRDVGVGCARGTFDGHRGVVMYTVDFGRRAQ